MNTWKWNKIEILTHFSVIQLTTYTLTWHSFPHSPLLFQQYDCLVLIMTSWWILMSLWPIWHLMSVGFYYKRTCSLNKEETRTDFDGRLQPAISNGVRLVFWWLHHDITVARHDLHNTICKHNLIISSLFFSPCFPFRDASLLSLR